MLPRKTASLFQSTPPTNTLTYFDLFPNMLFQQPWSILVFPRCSCFDKCFSKLFNHNFSSLQLDKISKQGWGGEKWWHGRRVGSTEERVAAAVHALRTTSGRCRWAEHARRGHAVALTPSLI